MSQLIRQDMIDEQQKSNQETKLNKTEHEEMNNMVKTHKSQPNPSTLCIRSLRQ